MKMGQTFNASRLVAAVDPETFESMDSELLGFWTFIGDVSLEYGGTFYNMDPNNLKYGYCFAVRVTDLASGCGYYGAVLVERITICGLDDKNRISSALECCGWLDESSDIEFSRAILYAADSLMNYGFYDPENNADYSPAMETLQLESDGADHFDGWTADRYQTNGDLRGYIIAKWLD